MDRTGQCDPALRPPHVPELQIRAQASQLRMTDLRNSSFRETPPLAALSTGLLCKLAKVGQGRPPLCICKLHLTRSKDSGFEPASPNSEVLTGLHSAWGSFGFTPPCSVLPSASRLLPHQPLANPCFPHRARGQRGQPGKVVGKPRREGLGARKGCESKCHACSNQELVSKPICLLPYPPDPALSHPPHPPVCFSFLLKGTSSVSNNQRLIKTAVLLPTPRHRQLVPHNHVRKRISSPKHFL